MTSTMAFTGTFNVTFDGMQFDGISTSGNISVLAAQNLISVSLQNLQLWPFIQLPRDWAEASIAISVRVPPGSG